jgi:hypothetical protein
MSTYLSRTAVFHYGTPIMTALPRYPAPGEQHTWALSEGMGITFARLCKVHLILSELALAYFAGPSDSVRQKTTLDFTERQYWRLLQWAEADEPLISQWDSGSHHDRYLQIIFHTGFLDISRSFFDFDISL